MSWTDALQQAEEALNDCSEDTHGCPKTLALLVALVEYAQALRNYAGERDEMVETLRKAITQVNGPTSRASKRCSMLGVSRFDTEKARRWSFWSSVMNTLSRNKTRSRALAYRGFDSPGALLGTYPHRRIA